MIAITEQIEKKIHLQVAHIMANYGDEPEELFIKLETLVVEWYLKGLHNVTTPSNLTVVECPACHFVTTVGHMDWTALKCLNCGIHVNRESWIAHKRE